MHVHMNVMCMFMWACMQAICLKLAINLVTFANAGVKLVSQILHHLQALEWLRTAPRSAHAAGFKAEALYGVSHLFHH